MVERHIGGEDAHASVFKLEVAHPEVASHVGLAKQ